MDFSTGTNPFMEQGQGRVTHYSIDGIDLNVPNSYIGRESLVARLITKTKAANGLLVLKSPPGTGKTSLLYLVEKAGRNVSGITVQYIRPADPTAASFDLFDHVKEFHGVDYNEFKASEKLKDYREIWLLFDDAQRLYGEEFDPFWETVVKKKTRSLENSKATVRVVVSATYYLDNKAESPVALQSEHSMNIQDLLSSKEEALDLFERRSLKPEFHDFFSKLYFLSNGALGPFAIGVNFLNELYMSNNTDDRGDTCSQNGLEEAEAVRELIETDRFANKLGRCFPQKKLSPKEHSAMLDAVTLAYNLETNEKAPDSEEMGDAVVNLCKAGILNDDLKFVSPAASLFYFTNVFPRPGVSQVPPSSLEALVVDATARLSASRLKIARLKKKGNPKEAVFQQLFHEAMYSLLPVPFRIIPGLGIHGEAVTGSLDFYIKNGHNNKWALELMRDGVLIGEHLARIPGKYYKNVEADEWLVVDFRYCSEPTEEKENLCSIVFSEEYETFKCFMRMRGMIDERRLMK